MESILDQLVALQSTQGRAVLASIVHVTGSAYRREGARMLFAADGTQYGTLSAGCLESDLQHRAEGVLQSGQPAVHVYDMASEDDFTWGRGAGCNGVISVLLEPLSGASLPSYWQEVLQHYAAGITVRGLRRIDQQTGETRGYLVEANGVYSGSLGSAALDAQGREKLAAFAGEGRKGKSEAVDGEWWVLERVQPKDRLFVFGAGPDAEPLVEVAALIGFEVTVVDHRPARLRQELFPRARRLLDCRPEQAAERLAVPAGSYAVVMTHSFQTDKAWLSVLLPLPLRYLGVLGPTLRTQRLLQSETLPDHVKSPIGLAIGADGPEEIAISVAAELVQRRRA
ncbi:MAG: XdhC family protein [Alicyclobacillus sp.]|nr:XdhC family protein [Alicyclobacillus sp.]